MRIFNCLRPLNSVYIYIFKEEKSRGRTNAVGWKQHIKRIIPTSVLNATLLQFPGLYKTHLVYYESAFLVKEIDALLHQLTFALDCKGDIVECGSSRCGTSIIMANFLRSKGTKKTIYALDSFEGFDQVELEREKQAGLTTVPDNACSSTSYEYVRKKIKRLGVEDIVVPKQGFFQDTLSHFDTPLCFSLIDCNLKDSIEYCAEAIWPHLVSGGRIVFDDYESQKFLGAKSGIDSFVNKYLHEFSEYGLRNNLYYARKK